MPTNNQKKTLPIIHIASRNEWETWLDQHHGTSDGIWMKLAKKDSGASSISHAEAIDTALCYGWIDSQAASYDDAFWLLRFTRRTPRSKWSAINREKATAFIAQGRMKEPGLREVEAARLDGRWERAYPSQATMTVPGDLQQRLDQHPEAAEFFAQLDGRNRYAILYRIHDAKKPATRAQRIEKFVAMLCERKALYEPDLLPAASPSASSTRPIKRQ